MRYISILVLVFILSGCSEKESAQKQWTYSRTVVLNGVNPIGITQMGEELWLSDGDHNRVVAIQDDGAIRKTIDSLERPMHLSSDQQTLFIPQYGNDQIESVENGQRKVMVIRDSLDAPAAIDVSGDFIAIADFYNNRIVCFDGKNWFSFGKEGKGQGEFYYPTDVHLTDDAIWVADAYNNRIQVFNRSGVFQKTFGKAQKMNAATGIFVAESQVLVTDFENNRVLIFDHNGALVQELKQGVDKPTDVLIMEGKLYITNYRKGELAVFE